MALQLNEDNFEAEVLNSSKPVLVDFWAEWCDVDEAQALAAKYGVRSIPFLLFFKDGEVKEQIVGANVTKDSLKEKLEAL